MSSYWNQFSLLWSFTLLALLLHGCMKTVGWLRKPKVPTVGIRSVFEAGAISNFRFYRNAEAILAEGYTKVGHDLCVVFTKCWLVQRQDFPVQETGCEYASPATQIRQ